MLELALAAALEATTWSQQRKPPEFRADVRLIRLDVSVVDRRGDSIAGLMPRDFSVTEDGRPVEITYFEAVEPQGTLGLGAGGPRWRRRPEGSPRRIFVLVDTGPLSVGQLRRARQSVARFLAAGTEPGDQVHLANLSTGSELSGSIPEDRARLSAAARSLSRRTSAWDQPGGRDPLVEREEMEAQGELPSEGRTSGQFLSVFARAAGLLGALEALMVELEGVEGRKAVVLVSLGFPTLRNLDRRLETVATRARDSATAVYFVDAAGLDGLTPQPGVRLAPAFEMAWNRSGGAQDLAEATGGFTFRFGNSLDPALNRIGSEMRTYYVLGYLPPRSADGRFHEVDVRVEVPGLKARTKKGYHAP